LAGIDWLDFHIVEVIDFNDDDQILFNGNVVNYQGNQLVNNEKFNNPQPENIRSINNNFNERKRRKC